MEAVFIYNNDENVGCQEALEAFFCGKRFDGHITYLTHTDVYRATNFTERRYNEVQVLSYNRIGTKQPVVYVVNTWIKAY